MPNFGNHERDNALAQGAVVDRIEEYSVKAPERGHPIYRQLLSERLDLHVEKSGGYGTGEDPFANFTAVAKVKGQPRFVYPVDRCLEKITRIYSLIEQGRFKELGEEFADCASLMDCAHAMLREDLPG